MKKKKSEYIVYVLLFVLPLLFIPGLNLAYELPKLAFFRAGTLLLLLSFGLKSIQARQISLPDIFANKSVKRLMGCFLIVLLLGTIFSVSPKLSFWGSYERMQGFYSWIHYFLFFILVSFELDTEQKWHKALIFLFTGAVLSSLYAILQAAGIDFSGFNLEEVSLGRAFAGMGHPNYLGLFLVMVVFLLMGFSLINKKPGMIAIIGILLLALFLTGSRAAFLGLFMELFLWIILWGIFSHKKKIIWGAILIPFLVGFSIVGTNVFDWDNRFNFKGENLRSMETRFSIWPETLKMINDRVFVGYGLDTFGITFPKYAPGKLAEYEILESRPDRAHNNFLDVMSQSGIVGLLLYIAFLMAVFRLSFFRIKTLDHDKKVVVISILATIGAIFTNNLFSFGTTVHYAIGAFILAYLAFTLSRERVYRKIKIGDSRAWRFLGVVALYFFTIGSILTENVMPVLADYYAVSGFEAVQKNDASAAINDFSKADFLNPNQDYYKYLLASIYTQVKDFERAESALTDAGKFSSFVDPYYHFLQAKLLALRCRDDEKYCNAAEKSFEKAHKMAPTHAATLFNFGKYYADGNDCEKALIKFEEYLELVPDFWKEAGTTQYRLFYKHNPDFDEVFPYIQSCK